MIGAGKNHSSYAVATSGLIYVVSTLDVGRQDFFKWPLDGHTAQMDNGIDVFHQGMHRFGVCQIALNDLLLFVSRLHPGNIGDPYDIRILLEASAQGLSEIATCTGKQNAVAARRDVS
ncbi:hypothetical protein X942_5543 [Burkholderia pseudomallei MSHR5596]|nr:hypothetical protein X942_5543 [Burkholderia pseudomallei MSHR5596]